MSVEMEVGSKNTDEEAKLALLKRDIETKQRKYDFTVVAAIETKYHTPVWCCCWGWWYWQGCNGPSQDEIWAIQKTVGFFHHGFVGKIGQHEGIFRSVKTKIDSMQRRDDAVGDDDDR